MAGQHSPEVFQCCHDWCRYSTPRSIYVCFNYAIQAMHVVSRIIFKSMSRNNWKFGVLRFANKSVWNPAGFKNLHMYWIYYAVYFKSVHHRVCVCVCVQNTESVNLSWLDDPCQLLIFETIDNHKRNFTDAAECTLLCFFGFLLLSGNRVDRDGNREYVGLSPESEQEGNNSLMVWMECWQIFCWRWPDQVLC